MVWGGAMRFYVWRDRGAVDGSGIVINNSRAFMNFTFLVKMGVRVL